VLDLGVRWAIMGTSALRDRPELERCVAQFGERIVVGIDARDGKVAVAGWAETSEAGAGWLAAEVEELGVRRVIYTDIATDGMMAGPNVAATREMAEAVGLEVIHSGGIATLADVRAVLELEPVGVVGCIVGRALCDGTLNLAEAVRLASS
jgi:phosphoribosylformimino-5-aminoimidazole carboxamide ribotide isomerase